MCGIVGLVHYRGDVALDQVRAMASRISHRGPDGDGFWRSRDGRVALGHRRLSIVDLSAKANQPMVDEEGRGALVYNGEFYNHQTLRSRLQQQGFRFQTDHSDSETLLAGCIMLGPAETLTHFNGMFAFAFYDPATNKLFLARDRVGIKPLYYAELPWGFAFASEIKALLALPDLPAKLDEESLSHYLSFRSLPAPLTLFKGIRKMAPGSWLVVDTRQGKVQQQRWWEPLQQPIRENLSEAEACDELEALLADSVRLRTLADVPLGVFLSGGLDSGYLLHQGSQITSPLSSFTVYYPGHDSYNEHVAAADLARAAKAVHHEIPIESGRYFEVLGAVSHFQDEPIAAPVCVSVYLLSEAARAAGVPVIFTGEGSDELFMGYPNWLMARDLQRFFDAFPTGMARFLANTMAKSTLPFAPNRAKLVEFSARVGMGAPLFWGGAMDFSDKEKRQLLGSSLAQVDLQETYRAIIEPFRQDYLKYRESGNITGWMSYLDLRFRLPELMLMRVDKMGMAFGIEGRVPFLDHRIVEFALSLPPSLRAARGRLTKPIVKATLARSMPSAFVYQPKRGFAAPMRQWKGAEASQVFVPALRLFAQRTGLFNLAGIDELLARPSDRLYFNLINFVLWYCIFIENVLIDLMPDPSQPLARARQSQHGGLVLAP